MKLVEIFPRLLEDCRALGPLPATASDAKEIFSAMDFSDNWSDANLRACISYIRGSWNMKIPEDWRSLLPTRF